MDTELFELCKEVYKRTGWATRDWIREDGLLVDYNVWGTSTPLYTSDYLLEKLPAYLEYWNGGNEAGYLVLKHWSKDYEAGYWAENDGLSADNKFTSGYSISPLKALLKLTIALHDAGELKQ
jgi:hypothetical protein